MLKPGTTFAAYTIVRELGRGGMGEVYEAEHTGLGKRVALKVMNHQEDDQGPSRQRFLLEGRAAARIRHENVVDVTDVGVHDGVPFLVMELLSGEPLSRLIAREAPLSARRVADLLVPVAGALAVAHDAGVLHRDVKPENIFLARDRRGAIVPKLVDFGVSRVGAITDGEAQRLTHSVNLIGTPRYLAPESVMGARNAVAASDQYALGVVLYECATGASPFPDDTLFSVLWSILQSKFPTPSEARPGVDPALEAVVLRAMRREPEQRFSDLRALAEALLPFASEATRARWCDEPAPTSLLASSLPDAQAAVTRDVAVRVTPPSIPAPAPRNAPTVPGRRAARPPRPRPRSLRLVALASAVALLCAVTFVAGRATHHPRAVASRPAAAAPPPAAPSPDPAVTAALASTPPSPPPPSPPPAARPARPAPRVARSVVRPVRAAPDPTPAPPPSSPWSLRTRF